METPVVRGLRAVFTVGLIYAASFGESKVALFIVMVLMAASLELVAFVVARRKE